jgi:hypothetical protein
MLVLVLVLILILIRNTFRSIPAPIELYDSRLSWRFYLQRVRGGEVPVIGG